MGKYRTDRVHEKKWGKKQRNNCSYLVRDVLENTFKKIMSGDEYLFERSKNQNGTL